MKKIEIKKARLCHSRALENIVFRNNAIIGKNSGQELCIDNISQIFLDVGSLVLIVNQPQANLNGLFEISRLSTSDLPFTLRKLKTNDTNYVVHIIEGFSAGTNWMCSDKSVKPLTRDSFKENEQHIKDTIEYIENETIKQKQLTNFNDLCASFVDNIPDVTMSVIASNSVPGRVKKSFTAILDRKDKTPISPTFNFYNCEFNGIGNSTFQARPLSILKPGKYAINITFRGDNVKLRVIAAYGQSKTWVVCQPSLDIHINTEKNCVFTVQAVPETTDMFNILEVTVTMTEV